MDTPSPHGTQKAATPGSPAVAVAVWDAGRRLVTADAGFQALPALPSHPRDEILSRGIAGRYEWRTGDGRLFGVSLLPLPAGGWVESFTEQLNTHEVLARREAVLKSLNLAATRFLSDRGWSNVVGDVLEHIGTAAGLTRLYLYRNSRWSESEWKMEPVSQWPQGTPARALDLGGAGWLEAGRMLARGQQILETIDDPGSDIAVLLQIDAPVHALWVPLFDSHGFWGVLRYDRVGGSESAAWPESEIEAMVAAGALLSAALRREQDEQVQITARDQAMQASAAKSEFLALMSHELRTPMNGVLGMLELLGDSGMSEQQGQFVRIARESADALMLVLNDILDLSRLESGRLELVEQDFNLIEVIESVTGLLAVKASGKGIDLAATVPEGVPVLLNGDAGRLRQVLMNLAGNAVKFTESGGVSVQVGHTGTEAGWVNLRIEIRDTGIGISPDALRHLFQEFNQADQGLNRRYGGTGLGLALARRLVGWMGGEIGVESKPGEGSLFWFTVRFRMRSPASAEQKLAGRRLLLLVPQRQTAEAMTRLLDSWGATVERCVSLESLQDRAEHHARGAHPVSAAIVSLEAIGADEEWLIEDIRRKAAGRLLLLAPIDADKASLPAGFDGVIHRPFRQSELLSSLLSTSHGVELAISRPRGRLLVVEDNETNMAVARSILHRLGYEVSMATNGPAAIEAVQRGHFDAVLMDIALPTMDGVEATRRIRSLGDRFAKLPIIALTANAMRGDRENLIAAGLSDYVPKPIRIGPLAETLERWIARAATPAARPSPVSLIDDENLARLREGVGPEMIASLVGQFLSELPGRRDRIEAGAREGSLAQLEREAHPLKSCAATFGVPRLAALAAQLEESARRGETDKAVELAVRLPALIEESQEALGAWLATSAPS